MSLFGYWPFSRTLAILWGIYDNGINWTTNTHMVYMSYARLRGIQAPATFSDEFLMKRSEIVMLSLWLIGFTIFTINELIFGMIEYTSSIDYKPEYIKSIMNISTWFIPVMLIAIFSMQVFVELKKRDKKKNENKIKYKIKKNFHLSATVKFQILLFTYWIQWFIPCIVDTIQPCNCISDSVSSAIYWLTYSVFIYYIIYIFFF